jgi:preprotein translocase subunit Sec61beta
MSKKNNPLPASSAGLLRFFEDETEGVKIKPEIVLVASMGLIVTSISINLVFPAPASSSSSSSVAAVLGLLLG